MSQKKADRHDHLNQHIPVLTDLADQEEDRQTVTVLDIQRDYHQSNPQETVTESELKARLRIQARRLIQNIIDEELIRIEAQLNRELNSYVDHLLEQMPENLTD